MHGLGGKADGVLAGEDGLDDLGVEKGERQQVTDVAVGDPFGSGDRSERGSTSGDDVVEPVVRADDGLDQRGVRFCIVPVAARRFENQPHLDAASLDADRNDVGDDRPGLCRHR